MNEKREQLDDRDVEDLTGKVAYAEYIEYIERLGGGRSRYHQDLIRRLLAKNNSRHAPFIEELRSLSELPAPHIDRAVFLDWWRKLSPEDRRLQRREFVDFLGAEREAQLHGIKQLFKA